VPILLLIFWLGVYPGPVLERAQPALRDTVQLTLERARMCRAVDAQTAIARAGERP
jgi:NADH:ubiquinone oxidoreductase subunit 4 (subunit M)